MTGCGVQTHPWSCSHHFHHHPIDRNLTLIHSSFHSIRPDPTGFFCRVEARTTWLFGLAHCVWRHTRNRGSRRSTPVTFCKLLCVVRTEAVRPSLRARRRNRPGTSLIVRSSRAEWKDGFGCGLWEAQSGSDYGSSSLLRPLPLQEKRRETNVGAACLGSEAEVRTIISPAHPWQVLLAPTNLVDRRPKVVPLCSTQVHLRRVPLEAIRAQHPSQPC